MTVTLVLGGARSGKSGYAESVANASGCQVVYIATAHAGDGEMAQRIAHHRQQRPAHWTTIEEPIHLAKAISEHAHASTVVLVDCLTLWLSNVMFADARDYPEIGVLPLPQLFCDERAALLDALRTAQGSVIVVSNEVGMGIMPMGAATRAFVDEAGRLNQAIAKSCDEAVFVAAGLPLTLKAKACLPV